MDLVGGDECLLLILRPSDLLVVRRQGQTSAALSLGESLGDHGVSG
jgi:hypothetical protein